MQQGLNVKITPEIKREDIQAAALYFFAALLLALVLNSLINKVL